MGIAKPNLSSNKRQSNIELLRIFAMIMIIAHHIAIHSNFTFSNDYITLNKLWIQFIQIGGKIGVNVFVLISGYFGITAVNIKLHKVLKLWLQIFTYSAFCFLIALGFLEQNFEIKSFIKNFLPITYSQWWFASSYFVLLILSPFINYFLNSLDKAKYRRFILLLTLIWCVIPTFFSVGWQSNSLLWLVFLYSISGYIRLHLNTESIKSKHCIFGAGAIILLTYLSAVVFDVLGIKISFFATHATYFYEMEKLPILLISILLFLGFLNMKIGYKSYINIISSATFGVYLIHDNDYIRNFLWITLFKNQSYSNSRLLIPYTILQIILVYILATLVELFRIYVIEKNYIKHLERCTNLTEKIKDKIKTIKLPEKIEKTIKNL